MAEASSSSEPAFGPAQVGGYWIEEPGPAYRPVSLTVTVAAPSAVAEENAQLRSQIRLLEQRVTREAQSWAEQRAALVKERETLRQQVDEKDAQIWKLMNGEVTLTGAAGKAVAKRKAAKDAGDKPSPAKKGVSANDKAEKKGVKAGGAKAAAGKTAAAKPAAAKAAAKPASRYGTII